MPHDHIPPCTVYTVVQQYALVDYYCCFHLTSGTNPAVGPYIVHRNRKCFLLSQSTLREEFVEKKYQVYDCERSELLIWQVHQFELGCIKLHTPYRYKVHPKLYSDWSMCTVFFFLRIESTAVQRCARKSTEFASGSKIVDENRGDMENFLVTQDSTHGGFC